jgi:hypothetical protein
LSTVVDKSVVVETTRRWIRSFVVDLNLCPFARRVFEGEKIRYVVADVKSEEQLLVTLGSELNRLVKFPIADVETTLLIHPEFLNDFFHYQQFVKRAHHLLERAGFEGAIQLATFHPQYQFADADSTAVENFTNRSPYPMLHLLREESVSKVSANPQELLDIPKRNIETLKNLGTTAVHARLASIQITPTSFSS